MNSAAVLQNNLSRQIIRLESRNSCALNLTDCLENERLKIFPYVEEKGLLFLQFRKNRIILSAGPYIGLIPLTPNLLVDVQPKLPVTNLVRVLDTARSSLATIAKADRPYLINDDASMSVFDFLGLNLIEALEPIVTAGFHKEYVSVAEVTGSPRGRIDLRATQTRWRQGHPNQVSVSRFEQTANVYVNRILKAALELILTKGFGRPETPPSLVRAANESYRSFPKAIQPIKSSDISLSREALRRRQLPAMREYYYRAINIALLLLSSRSISLQEQGDDVFLSTFILNFEDAFENYLRRALQARCEPLFWVRDGNREGRKSLFDDKKEPPAQPDMVIIEQETKKKLIAEVKYKERPNRDDINQAITYAISYRTRHSVLVHQKGPGRASGLQKIGRVGEVDLHSYAFDLASDDLELEEQRLATCLFALTQTG